MEFNSIEYIIFMAVVFILFQFMNQRMRIILLLTASYIFYSGWNVKYTLLIMCVTLVSYIGALCITVYPARKKKVFISSILIYVLILYVFKYLNFFCDIFNSIIKSDTNISRWSSLNIILPVGISFYIFQAIGYVAEVYKGNYKAEKNLLKYALFIAFFPQLVAGPIEKAENIIPQLEKDYKFDYGQITEGMLFIVWGLFKKMVIADEMAVYVDIVYGNVTSYTGFSLVIGTIMFAIQIYCDFSGYSDIAIGSAKMFGINLMRNFRAPYLSCSLQEFWTRWHISLSQWLKEYIYIPLGGGRKGKVRANINLVITFLVSGLWHGADLTYILWGGVNGLAGVIEKNIKIQKRSRVCKVISIIITFFVCCFAWIFFRSNTLEDAKYVLLHMAENIVQFKAYIVNGYKALGLDIYKGVQLAVSAGILFVSDILLDRGIEISYIRKLSLPLRWGMYLLLVLCILLFSRKGGADFVYFQF